MNRCPIVLAAVLGLASALTGCATPEFVRLEVGRSQATLGPAVDRLATDFEEHRAEVQDLTLMVTEIDRDAEDATRASIEALGVADVAVGRAAEAMSYATRALARADEARTLADRSLTEADRTDERLTWLWARRARPSVVGALVLRFGADQWTLDARGGKGRAGSGRAAPRESGPGRPGGGLRRRPWRATAQSPPQPAAGGGGRPLPDCAGRRASSSPGDRPGSYASGRGQLDPGGSPPESSGRRASSRPVLKRHRPAPRALGAGRARMDPYYFATSRFVRIF